jgi:hypothetical protein
VGEDVDEVISIRCSIPPEGPFLRRALQLLQRVPKLCSDSSNGSGSYESQKIALQV